MKRFNLKPGLALLVAASCMGSSATGAAADDDDDTRKAIAYIQGCTDPNISGIAMLSERKSSEGIKVIDVMVKVKGMTPGKHAVHIHEAGVCEPCGDALGHFDPGPNSNSNPDGNHPFHMGDLINIDVFAQVF